MFNADFFPVTEAAFYKMLEVNKFAHLVAQEVVSRINNGIQHRIKTGTINRALDPYAEQATLETVIQILEKSV